MTRFKLPTLRRLRRDERGTSAVEFALIAPILMVLMLGGFDTTRYVMAVRGVEQAASTLGQMIAVNTSGTISGTELQFYQDATMVIFPQVLSDSYNQGVDWSKDIAVTVSSVSFSATNNSYTGKVTWTTGTNPRPCNTTLTAVDDGAQPSKTTLPKDSFGPGSLIVVDMVFTYHPTVATNIIKPITITRSFYTQPRYVTAVVNSSTSGVTQCGTGS